MARDLRAELEQDTGESTAWRPEPGDILTGVLLGVDFRPSDYGDDMVPILHIRDDQTDEIRTVWCWHTVLREGYLKNRPQVGESVGIKYHGKQVSANGTEYHNYTFRVAREQGFSPMLAAPQARALPAPEVISEPELQGTRPPAGTVIDNRGNVVKPGNGNGNGARTLGEAAREKAGVGAAAASRPAPAADDPFAEE